MNTERVSTAVTSVATVRTVLRSNYRRERLSWGTSWFHSVLPDEFGDTLKQATAASACNPPNVS